MIDCGQWKPNSGPEAWLSPAILSSKFPSIQEVGSVSSINFQDPKIIDRIQRPITTKRLIISTLSFLHTTLPFI